MQPHPQPQGQGLSVSSLLAGLAVGVLVTLLATIYVVPASQSSEGGPLYLGEGGEDVFAADGTPLGSDGAGQGGPLAGESTVSGGNTGASGGATSGGPGAAGSSGSSFSGGGGPGGGPGGGAGSAQCKAGRNGGNTAQGVTGGEIKLGATVVLGGFASAFLGEVPQAMEAVVKDVNRSGGICGRRLNLVTKDDGWNAQRGLSAIENLVEQDKVFALAVSPSSEGLNAAAKKGVIRNAGIPVVGADGLNNTQFTEPLIWPVAAATTTTLHVIMKDAWERCEAKTKCQEVGLRPAIVYGNTYRFGVEGAHAFNKAYQDLACKSSTFGPNSNECKNGIPGSGGGSGCQQGSRYCGVPDIDSTSGYGNQVSVLNNACGGNGGSTSCNFLMLLLEPKSAQAWMRETDAPTATSAAGSGTGKARYWDGPGSRNAGIAGAQPLFTAGFARECGKKCDLMWVWTGYNPPLEQYAVERHAANKEYVESLHAQKGSADQFNQFTQGGYIGMKLLVEALRKTGPFLTRQRLADTLNSMPAFETGLAVPLKWTKSQRYANHSAQAFRIPAADGWTGGWEYMQGSLRRDPWLGQHNNG